MGVTGLWKVVEHCARPTKIETLNKKRLAVDASIWIYQFLKAVRDKEGNALRNSHVVGFFRRICKLLFIGILPVFVFDGGAPALKRQTIVARKTRREGRREDAAHTASKLLAREMQRIAEEQEQKRKDAAQSRLRASMPGNDEEEEEALPENLVYADEINMTEQEIQQTRKFKKTDQYHLPELSSSIAEMGGPDDPRVMSLQELETYARQFDSGEDINVYDFSKIDFDSPFFISLPASDRYNILNAARLRSRLRMGHSKEQLDAMFPDRMAFSKFQIERVRERNELTQRLMNINGLNDDGLFGAKGSERIAGEKGREYVLVRNDGVEGGWALGVVSNEGRETQPIDIEKEEQKAEIFKDEDDGYDEVNDDFEDVPIEGLNRLPKVVPNQVNQQPRRATGRRPRNNYSYNRESHLSTLTRADSNEESLFVQPEVDSSPEAQVEDDTTGADLANAEQEELDQAIALSLQQDDGDESESEALRKAHLDGFQQSRAQEARPLPKGSGKATAHILNSRAGKSAPKPVVPARKAPSVDFNEDSSDNDDVMDFQNALNTTQKTAVSTKPAVGPKSAPKHEPTKRPQNAAGFSGPLPFEKLDLGSSLLGKKKMQDMKAKEEGGFEKANGSEKKDAQPLPPWFAGDLKEGIQAQRKIEQSDRDQAKPFADAQKFEIQEPSALRREDTGQVIDLDAESPSKETAPIEVLDDQPTELVSEDEAAVEGSKQVNESLGNVGAAVEESLPAIESLGNVAERARAAPPEKQPPPADTLPPMLFDNGSDDKMSNDDGNHAVVQTGRQKPSDPTGEESSAGNSDEPVEWSDSDHGDARHADVTNDRSPDRKRSTPKIQEHAHEEDHQVMAEQSRSSSPDADFEDVEMTATSKTEQPNIEETRQQQSELLQEAASPPAQSHVTGTADQNNIVPDPEEDNFGYYTDSEDEQLMIGLAEEAEEHARFGAQLSNKPQIQIQHEYENEMKQLRSQQKKDRRDADEVTQIMIQECQQLLRLFGLPYITAPMEAEAQCAELVRLGLVDGIVTDDSDCFLFGGTKIYKNMFNQAKLVECYLAPDLEKEYDLTRQKLIDIAQLLGSDYTEGLSGIGHVKALEILGEFATLTEFRDWWNDAQATQYQKSAHNDSQPDDHATRTFKRKFKKAHVNKLFLPPGFPDPRVETAYLQPEVDSDPSAFQWGVPDLSALRQFLSATVGWSAERTDEVLVPVIRDMNRRETEGTQSNITAFMRGSVPSGVGGFAPKQRLEAGSKRAGTALDRMAKRAKGKKKR